VRGDDDIRRRRGDIRRARDVIGHVVKHTPVVSVGHAVGARRWRVVLKAENLQRTGAFKIRGAMNKLASLGARAVPASRAAAPATTPRRSRSPPTTTACECEIFVPSGAPISKIEACQGFGAR
jgi:threonine dehydratase